MKSYVESIARTKREYYHEVDFTNLYLFFLIPIFSVQTVSAQPDFEVGDWDIGFKDGENITKELDEDGDVSVEFWVRNDYPVAIEVSFNFDSAFGAETNEIDSTSVGAGEMIVLF